MYTSRRLSFALGILGVAGCLVVSTVTRAFREESVATRPLALIGGRLLTQTEDGPLEGTVLIRDGKIVAVGPTVAIPAEAERIDVQNHVVIPGLIDARSTLWLTPAAVREGASDGSLNVLDGIDPHAEDWKDVIRQGVTAVYVQPSSSGILGGRGAVLRVGPAEALSELVIKADAAAQAALSALAPTPAPTGAAGPPRRLGIDPPTPEPELSTTPTGSANSLTRFAQYEQLKRTFESVKRYEEEWKKYDEATKTKKEAAAKPAAEKKEAAPKAAAPQRPAGAAGAAARPRRDPAREFLLRVLKGEVPLRLEAHREDDVRHALRLAEEFKIRLILDGVSNPRMASAPLVSQRLPLVLGPFVEMEETPGHRRNRPADWPKALVSQDNLWALGTFSSQPRGSRLLRVQAAAAVAQGLDPQRVLRAITRDAAEILGVGDRLGTLAPGKQADVVVTAGDPLDPSVPVRLVVSAGKIVYRADLQPAPATVRETATPSLPARLPKQYALKTQCLMTEQGTCQPGMILVDKSKVVGLGSAVTVPSGVPVFDLQTAVLTPGLVAGPSDLGIGSAIDDPAEADAGQIRAADGYDPQHRSLRKFLDNGFTTVVLAPGAANVIAGTCSGLHLGAAEPILGDAGVKFVLTSSSRSASRAAAVGQEELPFRFQGRQRAANRYPASLAGQVELLEQVLSGRAPGTELYVPGRVRSQIQTERHRQVAAALQQKQVAFFEAHTSAEVDAALQLIARFKLRGVLVGPGEIKAFLDPIKQLNVGVVARSVQLGDYDRPERELSEVAAAGVPVAFGSASAQELRITAALAVNAGMPREAAWRGLTTAAGQMAGLAGSVGRLVVGGSADFVIWDGTPLDLRSRPLRVVVEGKVVHAAP